MSIATLVHPSKFQLLSEKIVTPSSPTPPHLRHYNLSYLDQLLSRKYIPTTLFYPHNTEKQTSPPSIVLEKSLSQLLSFYYPYAGRIVDNKVVDCNDKGALFTETNIMSPMLDILKQPYSTVQSWIFQNDSPWSDKKHGLEQDSLAIARITNFECGGKAISLSLNHKLGDSNTLSDFLLHWSALARGSSFPPPQLIGASLLPPNNDPFTPVVFDVEKQPHTVRRLQFDASKIDRLMALVASQSDIKNPTKVEALTALLNISLAKVKLKMKGSFSPFVINIPVNIRKRISQDLLHLMGNFLGFILIHVKDENDLELARLASMIRREKDRKFEKFDGLGTDDIPSAIRAELESFPTDCTDFRLLSSLCNYPLYDVDFGWGKPSRMSFGVWPSPNTFVIFDSPNGGVAALVVLEEQIMQEFLRDEQILEYASLDPSY